MNNQAIAELCLRAAEVIRRDGWIRGEIADPRKPATGAVCAFGALARAYGITQPRVMMWDRALIIYGVGDRVHRAAGLGESCLAQWNDRVAKDGEEVALVLEQAAANLKGSDNAED